MIRLAITLDEKIKQLEERKKRLTELQNTGGAVMKKISEKMKTAVDNSFRYSQSPDGEKWARLSVETTLAWNSERRGDVPLRDTGIMQRSITPGFGGGFAKVGTADIRAPTHQFGAKQGKYAKIPTKNGKVRNVPWGDIPARPFFGITKQKDIDYRKIILNYINNGVIK